MLSHVVDCFRKQDLEETRQKFTEVDTNADGLLTWTEYARKVFGYSEDELANFAHDTDPEMQSFNRVSVSVRWCICDDMIYCHGTDDVVSPHALSAFVNSVSESPSVSGKPRCFTYWQANCCTVVFNVFQQVLSPPSSWSLSSSTTWPMILFLVQNMQSSSSSSFIYLFISGNTAHCQEKTRKAVRNRQNTKTHSKTKRTQLH